MPVERSHPDHAERLTDEAARRVLARASELEAARSAEISLADLRDVAHEAGIPETAFEQALAELRGDAQPSSAEPATVARRRTTLFWIAAVPGLLIGGLTIFYLVVRMLDL